MDRSFCKFQKHGSSADHSFRNGDPWIVVTEDTCVFLVSRRVGGNLPKVQVISGISRLVKHNAVLGIQTLFHRIQCFLGKAFLHADSGNNAEALRLNENLSLFG